MGQTDHRRPVIGGPSGLTKIRLVFLGSCKRDVPKSSRKRAVRMPSAGADNPKNQFLRMVGPLGRLRDSLSSCGEGAMKFPRRQFLHLAAGAAALPVASRVARAQTYPTRPITMACRFLRAVRPT